MSRGEASPDQKTPAVGAGGVYTLGPITPPGSTLTELKFRTCEMRSGAARISVLCQIIPETKFKCDTTDMRSVSNGFRELLAEVAPSLTHNRHPPRIVGTFSALQLSDACAIVRSRLSPLLALDFFFFPSPWGRLPCDGIRIAQLGQQLWRAPWYSSRSVVEDHSMDGRERSGCCRNSRQGRAPRGVRSDQSPQWAADAIAICGSPHDAGKPASISPGRGLGSL